MTEQARVTNLCDICGQTDDHPKHHQAFTVGYRNPLTGEDVVEDKTVSRHFDCCNCDHCQIVLGDAGKKRGLKLAEHVQSKPASLHSALIAAGYEVRD